MLFAPTLKKRPNSFSAVSPNPQLLITPSEVRYKLQLPILLTQWIMGTPFPIIKKHFRHTQSHIALCTSLASRSLGFICRCCQDESAIWGNYLSLEKESLQDVFFVSFSLLILNLCEDYLPVPGEIVRKVYFLKT